jgi:hypothetical protein
LILNYPIYWRTTTPNSNKKNFKDQLKTDDKLRQEAATAYRRLVLCSFSAYNIFAKLLNVMTQNIF